MVSGRIGLVDGIYGYQCGSFGMKRLYSLKTPLELILPLPSYISRSLTFSLPLPGTKTSNRVLDHTRLPSTGLFSVQRFGLGHSISDALEQFS